MKAIKVLVCVLTVFMICSTCVVPTYAKIQSDIVQDNFDGDTGGTGNLPYIDTSTNIKPGMTAQKMLGSLIDTICAVAFYIGIIMVTIGVFMIIMAYKDDNPEAISRGARMAVIGALLVGIKAILKGTGLITA